MLIAEDHIFVCDVYSGRSVLDRPDRRSRMTGEIHVGLILMQNVHDLEILLISNTRFKIDIVVEKIFHGRRNVSVLIFLVVVPCERPDNPDAELVQNAGHLECVSGTHADDCRLAFELLFYLFDLRQVDRALLCYVLLNGLCPSGHLSDLPQPRLKARDTALVDTSDVRNPVLFLKGVAEVVSERTAYACGRKTLRKMRKLFDRRVTVKEHGIKIEFFEHLDDLGTCAFEKVLEVDLVCLNSLARRLHYRLHYGVIGDIKTGGPYA